MPEKTALPSGQSAVTQTVSAPPTVIIQRKSSFSAIALLALVVLFGGAGGAWFIQEHGRASAAPNGGGDQVDTVVHLDGFTVNLADSEDNHFLRVSMDLAVQHMPPRVERDKPNSGLPMASIRDTILSVLTSGKADVLLTPEGKRQLKQDLLDRLNRDNPALGVREIYFTEFLVQR